MLTTINNSRLVKTAVALLIFIVVAVSASVVYGKTRSYQAPSTGVTCTVSSSAPGTVAANCTGG